MTARERWRKRLGSLYWALKQGRPQGRISIPRSGLRPEHLAVVLPPEFHDFDVALPVLEPLLAQMNPHQATVVVRENFRSWISRDLPVRLVHFDGQAENWLGFPKEQTRRQMRDLGVDVVVDLTPGYSPYTAGLCAATEAAVRITLNGEPDSLFYNMCLQIESDKPLAERYSALLKYV